LRAPIQEEIEAEEDAWGWEKTSSTTNRRRGKTCLRQLLTLFQHEMRRKIPTNMADKNLISVRPMPGTVMK
tara:strand:- start:914 stop:1126 length:213 start_codon:yes stop_codon:yes gene_type:complete